MKNKRMLIIGAGLSGITMANLARKDNWYVEVHEKENDVGGLLRDEYDEKCGCYKPLQGPHILHFSKERGTLEAMLFVNKFTDLVPFEHKVLCVGNNGAITMWPINRTYNELNVKLNPQINMFDEFIKPYSQKMWKENTDEVIKNIEHRFKPKPTRNNLFFEGQETFLPKFGYSNMVKNMSDGLKINKCSDVNILDLTEKLDKWDKIVVTSHIDKFFNNAFGEIKYRGIDFDFFEIESKNNVLPTPVVNLSSHPTYTRISECNQLSVVNNTKFKYKLMCTETPSDNNRLYPVQTAENLNVINQYLEYGKRFKNIMFVGRQSEGKYLDMDTCIQNAINKYRCEIKK